MRLLRGRKKRQACVVGLDGVPFGLLARLAGTGVMPRTAAILRSGRLQKMRAALPPVSSVCWSSFMTGANPAQHGIFGFTDVDPDTYQLRFPLFSDLAAPALWDRLGEQGRRCAVINQPATYPARAVPGALVSGFVAPSFVKSVWPTQHLAPLRRMGYQVDVDTEGARDNPQRLLADLIASVKIRQQAIDYFWGVEDWDYFQIVVTETDRLHHFLWRAVENDGEPLHEQAMEFYQGVDALVGDVWERHARRSGEEGEGLVMLSDHGFCEAKREVCLNAWLKEAGYLQYRSEDPASVADIGDGTRAFCLDPGRIYVNRKRRFARGGVGEEASALAEEIANALDSLACEGGKVMAEVFRRDAVYRGSKVALAPELVALGRPGFDLKGTTKGKEVLASPRFQGMHTWDDAFVWSRLALPEEPEISDIASPLCGWLLD